MDNLVITAIEQAVNSLRDYDIGQAIRSVTVKLVGYTEVVRVLHTRFATGASVVLFGGLAKDRPYPGSTMVTTFNAGVSGLVRTLAVRLRASPCQCPSPRYRRRQPEVARCAQPPAPFPNTRRASRDNGRDRRRN